MAVRQRHGFADARTVENLLDVGAVFGNVILQCEEGAVTAQLDDVLRAQQPAGNDISIVAGGQRHGHLLKLHLVGRKVQLHVNVGLLLEHLVDDAAVGLVAVVDHQRKFEGSVAVPDFFAFEKHVGECGAGAQQQDGCQRESQFFHGGTSFFKPCGFTNANQPLTEPIITPLTKCFCTKG